jgi:hypothetical protein
VTSPCDVWVTPVTVTVIPRRVRSTSGTQTRSGPTDGARPGRARAPIYIAGVLPLNRAIASSVTGV